MEDNTMKRIGMAVALAGMVGFAGTANGQACVGAATTPGIFSAGGNVGFASDARVYGAEFGANFQSPVFAGGSFAITDWDREDWDNWTTFGAQVGYELGAAGVAPMGYSICPTLGVASTVTGFGDRLEVPLGLGLGSSFGMGGFRVIPFVHPQFAFLRWSPDNGEADTDSFFRVHGGATLDLGTFYVQGTLGQSFEEGPFELGTLFGIGAGVKF